MAKELRLGGHLNASEGLSFPVATARGLCYNELQINTGTPTTYAPWELEEKDVAHFRLMTYEMKLTVHAPYVINPCEGAANRRGFYKKATKDHRKTAEALGAKRFVLHPGFKKDLKETEAFANLLRFIEETWKEEASMELLLETDSGSKNGSAIGSADFISEVIRVLAIPNVRMCIDTEHLYARGTNLWDPIVRKEFLDEHGPNISLVHLNVPDPNVTPGSFLDRHNTAFEQRGDLEHEGLITDLAQWPMILERRSLAIQQMDNLYVRTVLGQPLEKKSA